MYIDSHSEIDIMDIACILWRTLVPCGNLRIKPVAKLIVMFSRKLLIDKTNKKHHRFVRDA